MSEQRLFDSTVYYDQHAQEFEPQTARLDLSRRYQPFLARLSPAAVILDAGCGPGRDAMAFQRRGYLVQAFAASAELTRLAKPGGSTTHLNLGRWQVPTDMGVCDRRTRNLLLGVLRRSPPLRY